MTRYLIVKASGGGGLGDSIKSVLTGALYAAMSERVLVVDWHDGLYATGKDNVFPKLFSLTGIEHQYELPAQDDIYPVAWQGRLERSLHEIYHEDGWQEWNRRRTIDLYSFDLTQLNLPHRVLVMWEFDQLHKLLSLPAASQWLGGKIQSDRIAVWRELAARFLRLSASSQQRLDRISDLFDRPTLGVHIRATHEFEQNKGGTSLDAYWRAIDACTSRFEQLYLATDNVDVQTRFQQRYPDAISLPKWFARPGESLHLNPQQPDKMQGVRDALLEVCALSKCRALVLTRDSSFSELACILGDQTQQVMYPQQNSLLRRLLAYLPNPLKE